MFRNNVVHGFYAVQRHLVLGKVFHKTLSLFFCIMRTIITAKGHTINENWVNCI